MSRNFALPFLIVAALSATPASEACTTFATGDAHGLLIGKNFDWTNGRGLLMINKRDMSKRSMPEANGSSSFGWVSRHGSVSFNWIGAEFAVSGLNEAGLAIETLVVLAPPTGGEVLPRPEKALSALQWVQYQLDTSSTLEDALGSLRSVGFWQLVSTVHFFVCDASSRCAVIESAENGARVHHIRKSHLRVLENAPYAPSAETFEHTPERAPSRFAAVAGALSQLGNRPLPQNRLFDLLDSVKLGTMTQWQLAWDVPGRRVTFRFPGANSSLQNLDFSELDFSCQEPTGMAVLDGSSYRVSVEPFSKTANEATLQASLTDMRAATRPHGSVTLLEAARTASHASRCTR